MQRSLLLACLFAVFSAPAVAAPEWKGSVNWRYLIRNSDDGLNATVTGRNSSQVTYKAHQLRADLNAFEKGEVWDWGIGIRTGGTSANSEWTSLQNNADLTINFENAFFRGHNEILGGEGSVTVGRAKSVVLFDPYGQVLFDKDVRFDGLGWVWQKGNFGLGLSQYVIGARNSGTFGASTFSRTEATEAVATTQSGFGMLYSIQPNFTFELSEDIKALVAVGYHHWAGAGGSATFENAIHGGTAAPTTASNIPGATDNRNPLILDNPRQWQVMTDWTLPYTFRFVGEYIQNKEVFYGTRAVGGSTGRKAQTGALALTLAYGKVKKANDWSLSYTYARRGIASAINAFANGNMPADNIGHLINGAYALADGLSIGAKVELYKEKAKLAGDGLPVPAPGQNRNQEQNRYEFYAGVAF